MQTILVSGATGMVGAAVLTQLRLEKYKIHVLSTRKNVQIEGAKTFFWNPQQFEMDSAALAGVTGIIHLAGATVSKRWTTSYKQEIYDSRTRTSETLHRAIAALPKHDIKSFVSASAVGYYKSDLQKNYVEADGPGNDFLSQVCQAWELAADKFENLNINVAKLRIGIVLGRSGGVLQQLETPTKFGLGAALGDGQQWQSWIHVKDLGRMFVFATAQALAGVYNAAAPNPETNQSLSHKLAKAMDKPFFFPAVPAIALKIALGEMAAIALMSQKVNSKKIEAAGFHFNFTTLDEALKDLYPPKK